MGKLVIRESDIQGLGVFTTVSLKRGQDVGRAFIRVGTVDVSDKDYIRTVLGRLTKHSDQPNVNVTRDGKVFRFVANQPVAKDEELLVNYGQFPWEENRNKV